ncbi:ATP-binding protein [Streptomyces sp. NPDC001941]|uniref:hybrid sensor histidine kinase/response regulator n=1 Tax=Streptomyces sp. NPDC001941 TaxID=3154659 RepID=UPI003320E313
MNAGGTGHELTAVTLREGRDVLALRRATQSACRTAGVADGSLVRLTTVVSEAGEQLLGADALTARLLLEGSVTPVIAVHLRWRGARRPPASLLTAATRLLDDSTLTVTEDGDRSLALAQRVPAPEQPVADLADEIRRALAPTRSTADLIDALRTQNHELLASLEESQAQKEELQRLNAELEETNAGVMALYTELTGELQATNSGVVALYAELEDKTRQLVLANEYKTRFWANVSHELRSPVNSVIALARLLLDPHAEPLSEEQKQQISLVHASGNTLLALVDELLDVAKAESGRLEPQAADTDLRALLHQLRGMLRGTAQPGVELLIPDHTSAGALVTDEVMLTRVLRNVLSNALKFTSSGTVALEVEEVVRDGKASFVFRVVDSGVGIPPGELERVFEEFYQVRGPHQRGRSGTGLGLPYARSLTKLLGGSIALDSEVGRGTRVTVEIPALLTLAEREAAPDGPAAPDALAPDTAPEAEGAPRAADSPRVLVVDDDEAFLATLRPLLAGLTREVTVLTDSARALDTAVRERPDAVLLDLTMPDPDGYRVRHLLAAHQATARIPVIVLTALDGTEVDHSRLEGVHAILNKSRLTEAGLATALRGAAPAAAGRPAPSPSTTERPDPTAAPPSTAEERA